MKYQLITNNKRLAALCQSVRQKKAIALDTEFIRVRTYYPKIGLIQLFDGDHVALIDPLAIDDWQCLSDVLRNKNQQKYFHSCGEDLDVFMHKFNFVPTPIIDSQILAAFLDNDLCTSYATLVNKYLNVSLSKTETRTDWLARPLSEKQCHYASDDVFYLLPLVDKLINLVQNKGWFHAAIEECQLMIAKKVDMVSPAHAYLAIKKSGQLTDQQINNLQRLAAWRLQQARAHDIAVNFILSEAVMLKIAREKPTSLAKLHHLGVHSKEIRLYGHAILALLNQSAAINWPRKKQPTDYLNYKLISEHLKRAVVDIAKETGLRASILLTRRHINHYVEWVNTDKKTMMPELLSGWRAPFFKPYLDD